jgi:hypothetical protein
MTVHLATAVVTCNLLTRLAPVRPAGREPARARHAAPLQWAR